MLWRWCFVISVDENAIQYDLDPNLAHIRIQLRRRVVQSLIPAAVPWMRRNHLCRMCLVVSLLSLYARGWSVLKAAWCKCLTLGFERSSLWLFCGNDVNVDEPSCFCCCDYLRLDPLKCRFSDNPISAKSGNVIEKMEKNWISNYFNKSVLRMSLKWNISTIIRDSGFLFISFTITSTVFKF